MNVNFSPAISPRFGNQAAAQQLPSVEQVTQELMFYKDGLEKCSASLNNVTEGEKTSHRDYEGWGHLGNAGMIAGGASLLAMTRDRLVEWLPGFFKAGAGISDSFTGLILGPIAGAGIIGYPLYSLFKNTVSSFKKANKAG